MHECGDVLIRRLHSSTTLFGLFGLSRSDRRRTNLELLEKLVLRSIRINMDGIPEGRIRQTLVSLSWCTSGCIVLFLHPAKHSYRGLCPCLADCVWNRKGGQSSLLSPSECK